MKQVDEMVKQFKDTAFYRSLVSPGSIRFRKNDFGELELVTEDNEFHDRVFVVQEYTKGNYDFEESPSWT